ncbi:hypothetical protein PUN4_630019 [Paraburkholderia unamae]|nr:hypothetical protein PUN4_630019 [Paraburkholderia unamae]
MFDPWIHGRSFHSFAQPGCETHSDNVKGRARARALHCELAARPDALLARLREAGKPKHMVWLAPPGWQSDQSPIDTRATPERQLEDA